MTKFETIIVSKEQATKAERMISWFSKNIRKEEGRETVKFVAALDEKGLKNVLSSLRS